MELNEFKDRMKAAKLYFIIRMNHKARYAQVIGGAFFSFEKAVEYITDDLRGAEGKLDQVKKKGEYFVHESYNRELEEFRYTISNEDMDKSYSIKSVFLYNEDINEIIDMNTDIKIVNDGDELC